jgi:hypothetical protein
VSDPLYPKSGAYHEAGHIVTAAVQGLRLSRHGIHVDSDGRGISYYEYRKPKQFSNHPSQVSREHTIIAIHAGLLAQQKFHPRCSVCGASDDQNLVDMLIKELDDEDPIIGLASFRAQVELPNEAHRLVELHWPAIEAVAEALWGNPEIERTVEPETTWSNLPVEKRLNGSRIVEILEPFDIHASVWDAEAVVD